MPILSRVGTGLFLKSAGGGGGGSAEPGEAVFHADKTTQIATFSAYSPYTWTVPEGVTEIDKETIARLENEIKVAGQLYRELRSNMSELTGDVSTPEVIKL